MAIFPQGFSDIAARCLHTEDGTARGRVLQQLNRCLDDDCLVWHRVSVGHKGLCPDFVILNPGRGLLILEAKGWLSDTLQQVGRNDVELNLPTGRVTKTHPVLQARGFATALVNQMQQDPLLCESDGPHAGKLMSPWGWGAALTHLSRSEIVEARWDDVFPTERTLTQDDLSDDLAPGVFQERLWQMLTASPRPPLTPDRCDRMRWHLFPEMRIQSQASLQEGDSPESLAGDEGPLVMDLQQERWARAPAEGHRVVHGVAGSGKTMILIHRVEKMAPFARPDWPLLVLCFSKPLSLRIEALIRARGIDERVQVRTFYSWCHDMAQAHQLDFPWQGWKVDYDALARIVIEAVAQGRIPRGAYAAVVIDEAHEFDDDWLRFAPQLVDPSTQSLLLLCDEEQSVHRPPRSPSAYAGLGIEAQGRTGVLRVHHRSTAEILALAIRVTRPGHADSEPNHGPSGGCRGPRPVLLHGVSPKDEASQVAQHMADALAQGLPPTALGILARHNELLDPVERALKDRGIATHRLHGAAGRPWPTPGIRLATLHAASGLAFHTVAIVGLQALPDPQFVEEAEWRLLYLAMMRATHRLVLAGCGASGAVERVAAALDAASHGASPAA